MTDDQVHGEQEGAFFNTYYDGVCYAPLYIFCGKHLLVAKLRPSNVYPAEGALEELKRVIELIRSRWPDVGILVRGDSAYAREEIMEWCESQVGVDYVFGLSKNSRLMTMTLATQRQACVSYEQTLQTVESFLETLFHPDEELKEVEKLVLPCVLYRSLNYQTEKSWSRFRRVVSKVEYSHTGVKVRFVVTCVLSLQPDWLILDFSSMRNTAQIEWLSGSIFTLIGKVFPDFLSQVLQVFAFS